MSSYFRPISLEAFTNTDDVSIAYTLLRLLLILAVVHLLPLTDGSIAPPSHRELAAHRQMGVEIRRKEFGTSARSPATGMYLVGFTIELGDSARTLASEQEWNACETMSIDLVRAFSIAMCRKSITNAASVAWIHERARRGGLS